MATVFLFRFFFVTFFKAGVHDCSQSSIETQRGKRIVEKHKVAWMPNKLNSGPVEFLKRFKPFALVIASRRISVSGSGLWNRAVSLLATLPEASLFFSSFSPRDAHPAQKRNFYPFIADIPWAWKSAYGYYMCSPASFIRCLRFPVLFYFWCAVFLSIVSYHFILSRLIGTVHVCLPCLFSRDSAFFLDVARNLSRRATRYHKHW